MERQIDMAIDEYLKRSLESSVSESFTSNLMKQIELEEKFAAEDKKEKKIAWRVISGIAASIAVLTGLLTYVIASTGKYSEQTAEVNSDLGFYYESLPEKIFSMVGVSLSLETFLMILLTLAAFSIFALGDKILLRKK